jgi:hypothetical protein
LESGLIRALWPLFIVSIGIIFAAKLLANTEGPNHNNDQFSMLFSVQAVQLNEGRLCFDSSFIKSWLPSKSSYRQAIFLAKSPSMSHADTIQCAVNYNKQKHNGWDTNYRKGKNPQQGHGRI